MFPPKMLCQTFGIFLKSNVWPFGQSYNVACPIFFLPGASIKWFNVSQRTLLNPIAKQYFVTWSNGKTFFIQHLKFACQAHCLSNIFCLRQECFWISPKSLLIFVRQTMFCDVAKRSNTASKANFKCLKNNVWSFDQSLNPGVRLANNVTIPAHNVKPNPWIISPQTFY